jgi:hypothetical protein
MHHSLAHLVFVACCIVAASLAACDEKPGPVDTLPLPPTAEDTTTHEYSWSIQRFGDQFSGSFDDVCAVSDSDAYAVGYLDIRDSTGHRRAFSACHWDGISWKCVNLPQPVGIDDSNEYARGRIIMISIDKGTGYCYSNGAAIVYFDGTSRVYEWNAIRLRLGVMATCVAQQRRFFACIEGEIYQRDVHGNYRDDHSPTTLSLTSIHGNDHEVFAVGGMVRTPEIVRLWKDGNVWRNIDSCFGEKQTGVSAVWCDAKGFKPGGFVGWTGDGVVYHDSSWKLLKPEMGQGLAYSRAIHGTARNNVFVVGDFGSVWHYNGKSWHWFKELWRPEGMSLRAVWVAQRNVFIVGTDSYGLCILTGRMKS